METRKLEQEEWAEYFDSVTRRLVHEKTPVYTEVRVMNPLVGAQTEVAWQPLFGMTFDVRENKLEIATDPVDHMITGPEAIYVIEEGGLPTTVEVETPGMKQVIELRY